MRHPGHIFGSMLAAGGCLYLFVGVLQWSSFLAVLGLVVFWILGMLLLLFLQLRFDEWVARQVNPLVRQYQKNRDIDALVAGLAPWKRRRLTRLARNAIAVNEISALFESGRAEQALREIRRFGARTETVDERIFYHDCMIQYWQITGDGDREQRELQAKAQLQLSRTRTGADKNAPATAAQSRKAFLRWLACAALMFLGYVLSVCLCGPHSGVGTVAFLLWLLTAIAALGWAGLWLARAFRERREPGG